MFHHRSCGTTALVALMAAHRAALGQQGSLRQQDITRLVEEELAAPGPANGWAPGTAPREALPARG
ncbi:hypothetical protein CR162_14105 [Pseudoroseomonas rhizosphaerae]|uniref:Uncharacterized protein n=1 Tax=Teichococcus rhizosphaerae TaxID=1335062 RepID=A0A2C7A7B7_9PROT|nr:hypothetical protein [Pseudoroseomonas rhizosphaerae]PHK94260.1 hypothetical protein CR162_14105 [Pseudoroseomonas rhizosphaerae]